MGPGRGRQARVRGRPDPLHGGAQRRGAGRVRGGRDRRRGDGLPRRGRGPLVQQPRSPTRWIRGPSSWCRRAGPSTPASSSRAATPPCSSASTRWPAPSAACSRTPCPRPTGTRCTSTASRSARSASTPRCAAPGARPSRSSRATTSSARSRRRCSGPGLQTLAVKTGLGRFSARHLSPARARERDRAGVPRRAARPADAPVYDPGAPCTITVELNTADQADPYRNRGDVVVTGPRTIEATAEHVVGGLARDLPDALAGARVNAEVETGVVRRRTPGRHRAEHPQVHEVTGGVGVLERRALRLIVLLRLQRHGCDGTPRRFVRSAGSPGLCSWRGGPGRASRHLP